MMSTNAEPSAELIERLQEARTPSADLRARLGLADLRNVEITDERIQGLRDQFRAQISFWRAYPDLFIEFLAGEDSKFKFYSYQRIMLRANLRYTYVFQTFPRAYSKSFIAVMSLMIKAILYPGIKLFTTTAGKQQATQIATEKFNEICDLIPAFKKEVDWRESSFGKDYIKIVFYNKSCIEVMAAQQTTRGRRAHGGLIEEARNYLNTLLPICQWGFAPVRRANGEA